MNFHREVFGILLTLLILQVVVSVYSSAYLAALPFQDKIYPGVSVKGIPLDGLSREEASKVIEERIQFKMPQEVVLKNGESLLRLNLHEAGVAFDPMDTVERAYQRGREGGLPYRLLGILRTSNRPDQLPILLALDEEKLKEYLTVLSQERAKGIPSSEGQMPDVERIREALQTFFGKIYACDVVVT